MNLKERVINGLYGQAVLDSCGNPFEFERNLTTEEVIGYANLTEHLVISDDSQMAMHGFEAIQNMNNYSGIAVEKQIEFAFTDSYLNWYETQSQSSSEHQFYENGLLSFKSMWDVQAPGNTCLSALNTLGDGGTVRNDSMGCGSVMRLLPLVLLFDKYSYVEVLRYAVITGNITHKHKNNVPAIHRYMKVAYNAVNDIPVENIHPEVTHASQLGDGWIAPECVEIAIWAYCTATSFDDLLARSIAHNGDSDSTGAVAGSLWGLSGREVPKKYIDKLDAINAIKYVINKL